MKERTTMPTLLERSTEEIEFIKKGQITIPKRLRDQYKITPGQKGTIIPINGGILIVPGQAETPMLFNKLREGLGTTNMTLEEMIAEMRDIRDTSDYEINTIPRQ